MKDLEFFKLEERVLFEAAAVAEIVEAADAASQTQESSDTDSQDLLSSVETLGNAPVTGGSTAEIAAADPEQLADVDAELNALIDGVIPGNAEDQVSDTVSVILQDKGETVSTDRELVIIDSSLKDIDSVLEQIRPDQDVLILEDNNGMTEINEYLSEQEEKYSAVHFITHGDNDGIIVNDQIINQQTFNAEDWTGLKEHLTSDGEILFYGCSIAEKAGGKELIDQISEVCNADVAASTDVTGITGNWELEYATGSIDAVTIQIDAYQSDLAETIVSTYGELYDALEDAAVNGGDYTITISNDITIDSYPGLSFLIRKDLNLTIKGLNADINLTGGNGVNIFEFYEYDAEDYQIEISIDSLNFNGQGNAASAVLASGVEKLTISNSKIENFINTAVRHESYGGVETLEINGVQFLNNSASTYSGGAVSAFDVSVTIDGSYFYNNSSTQMGGALEIQGAPVLTISNSTFEVNKNAYDGGAINVDMGTDGVVNIDNTTFYGNMTEDAGTGGSGGALCIHQNDDSSTVRITNSTFTKNTVESTGEGRAFYLSGKGNAEIINTLLIGEGDSVVANESSGTLTLSYSLATSSKGSNIVLGTNAEVNAEFTHENVFGSNTYDPDRHTIAPDAFHKAAWSGTNTGTGLDQLEISRETINNIPGLSGKYTIGAVTAAAGLIVTQGDYSTDYTGSVIQPVANLTLAYADGTVMSQTVTATLTSNPGTILEIGDYTITPSDASVTGIDTAANVEYQYVSGTLTVEAWEELSIQDVTINSTYGDTPDLSSTYTFTTLDKNTGNDIELTVNVTWEIDKSVITDGDYSATDHLNAKLYENSLTVKDFTVRDQNGNDMKSCFTWDTSAKSDLDVAQRTVTITLNDLTDKIYNGKTDDAVFNGGTVSGVISGESLNVTVDPGEYGVYNSKNIDAVEAAFTVVLAAGTNTDLANYSFNDQAVAKAKITPATLKISVNDQENITYGDSVVPSHTVTGLCSPDTVSVTYAVSGAVSTSGNYAVGDHTITISDYTIDDGMDGQNYNVETVGDSFKVSERSVTVTIDGALFNKVYDGTTATETADNNSSSSDIIAGDVVEISGNFVYDNKNADTGKTVTMSGITLSGTDAGNYKLTSDVAQGNNAVITPLELNVSVVVPDNKVYDGTTSVDSKVSADNIIQGDDVVIDAAWDYNSPDVADATTVSNSSWQLSGADAGNYSLPAVDPYQEFSATISGKPVDTVFETDSPYYYNGTDQSGSVSAYYIDINGNKVQLTINWNGKVFKNAGDYTITAESNDQNYVPVGNSLQLTMNFPAYQPHVYCEGLYPGYFNTMQGMRAELESMDGVVQGDIYTMTYPELVSRTMLHFNMPDMQSFAELYRVGGIASVDSLKYYPFEIDEPVREISVSVIGSSKLTHESSLYSGEELFTEHGDQEFIQLFGQRGDTLSVDHKPLCVEDGAVESEELSAGYVFLPESMAVPSRFFAMDRSLDEQFRNLTAVNEAQCRRVNNLKSNLEKLLDDLCFA